MFGVIAIVFANILAPVPGQIDATSSITVTSTTPYPESNNMFGDISYNASFSQCADDSSLWNIAYIEPEGVSLSQFNALVQIATAMNETFKTNNPGGPAFSATVYSTQSELDDYTSSRNYFQKQYCFAYSFPVWELDVAKGTYEFEFNLQFGQNLIGSTNLNQTQTQSLPFYMYVKTEDK